MKSCYCDVRNLNQNTTGPRKMHILPDEIFSVERYRKLVSNSSSVISIEQIRNNDSLKIGIGNEEFVFLISEPKCPRDTYRKRHIKVEPNIKDRPPIYANLGSSKNATNDSKYIGQGPSIYDDSGSPRKKANDSKDIIKKFPCSGSSNNAGTDSEHIIENFPIHDDSDSSAILIKPYRVPGNCNEYENTNK